MTQFCLPVVEQTKVFLRIQFHFNKYIYIISTSIVIGACWKIWRPIKCLLCGFFFYKVELCRKSTNLTSFQFYFGLIILKPIMLEIKMIFFFHESCRHCWTALLCTYLKHSVTIEKKRCAIFREYEGLLSAISTLLSRNISYRNDQTEPLQCSNVLVSLGHRCRSHH